MAPSWPPVIGSDTRPSRMEATCANAAVLGARGGWHPAPWKGTSQTGRTPTTARMVWLPEVLGLVQRVRGAQLDTRAGLGHARAPAPQVGSRNQEMLQHAFYATIGRTLGISCRPSADGRVAGWARAVDPPGPPTDPDVRVAASGSSSHGFAAQCRRPPRLAGVGRGYRASRRAKRSQFIQALRERRSNHLRHNLRR